MTSLESYDPAGTQPIHKLRRFSLAVQYNPNGHGFLFAEKVNEVEILAPWPLGPPPEALALMSRIRQVPAWGLVMTLSPRSRVIWRGQASDPLTALEAAAVSAGVDL